MKGDSIKMQNYFLRKELINSSNTLNTLSDSHFNNISISKALALTIVANVLVFFMFIRQRGRPFLAND